MNAEYTTRTTCRVCGSVDLTPLFSLGIQHVSDFVTADKIRTGPRVPIELELCKGCSLVQAKHTASSDFMYSRFYWFRSGVTQTIRDALQDVAEAAQHVVNLQPGDVVLDIGSNDSTGLRAFTASGIIRVGCEPANNLAEEARVGIDCLIREFWSYAHYSLATYFDKRTARWERLPKAKVITACGMLYDSDNPNQFVGDVAKALAPDGVFIAQLMCLKQMIERKDVGNLAHEHLLYPSLLSLDYLFKQHGLQIFDVEENNVNGGSYRLYARHLSANTQEYMDGNEQAIRRGRAFAVEDEMRLDDPATYSTFFTELQTSRNCIRAFVQQQVQNGKRVHVLGASTKGNVLLQFWGLNWCLIEAASERSPAKHGLYTIGTGIPIISEEQSRAMRPDLYLVLPYSFRNEILEREREFRERGGKMVFPLPTLEVV